mmetsp:Transcript_33635/g.49442  ORF Transcript_33635/g.49442 Transcript_33635/m.49442 type:complete len:182 (-) Transcript_33635:82-627(-)|eukprot:CAMPEP_0195521020 /NCGR_PEP_ID=MMETSP0794_2-20130614/17805_1 /TAXON_ID=515487 /ORGANISM="Stephanopyxis turris, Strain CCMP 815" /LENGTH=181 /DNA_ID=CAMNT_0040650479 /DNA_START=85 /DNA_END=630 /DNA_ORIENTATION=+
MGSCARYISYKMRIGTACRTYCAPASPLPRTTTTSRTVIHDKKLSVNVPPSRSLSTTAADSTPAAPPSPAPASIDTPTTSASEPSPFPASTPPKDSLHSTDIAFKPTQDGWGYNPRYSSSWDNIFANNKKTQTTAPTEEAASVEVGLLSNSLKQVTQDALNLSKEDQRQLVEVLNVKLGLK